MPLERAVNMPNLPPRYLENVEAKAASVEVQVETVRVRLGSGAEPKWGRTPPSIYLYSTLAYAPNKLRCDALKMRKRIHNRHRKTP